MKSFYFALLLLSSGTFSSCSKEDSAGTNTAQLYADVSYGTEAMQKMDVYLPANRSVSSTKTFVMIHGGGWSEGDKIDFNPYVDTLRKRFPDYAIANINYRLATGSNNFFPTQENDIKAAVEFYLGKTQQYGVSNKLVLIGASAGAHLAMLHAYKNDIANSVKAVVNFFGPSDMTDLHNNPASPFVPASAVAAVVGATPTSNPTLYFQSSPINFIKTTSPPTISLQGGLDPLVRPTQQEALKAKLTATGVTNEYVFYPTEFHGWVGANLANSFNRIQAFITTNVQ